MDYPAIGLPITRLLLAAAVITDDRIIITWGRPIKRDQLYSINCGLRAFRRSKDLDGARE